MNEDNLMASPAIGEFGDDPEGLDVPGEEISDENVLKLQIPLKANGQEYDKLCYDFESLTAKDLHEVSKYLKQVGSTVMIPAFDYDYQLCLFHKAVKKKMPKIALSDILRMSGSDANLATGLARAFLLNTDPGQRELGDLLESDE
ncbi:MULTISPECIES: hypothetical protein [Anaerotruncus]|uniref:hypothetical protein n=1 Tax=Anaerotruncus TaxID=244127 RepID=UPI000E4E4FB3|nr:MULTISPECIES: hypothetical protein [Anaerotruncus]RGX53817.1 hypothetical protein DWV16_16025 [Anaerotruncus sp. AF02-27]